MTDPVVLVVAHAADAGAHAVAARLQQRRGAAGVRMVRPESLAAGAWSHRVDRHGTADTTITVAGAPPLASRSIGVVFHRILRLQPPHLLRARAKDRDYAAAEMQALMVSFLAAFGNRAVPDARRWPWLAPPLSASRWSAAAADAGLRVATDLVADGWPRPQPHRTEPAAGSRPVYAASRVLVAGTRVLGELGAVAGAACVAVAHGLGLPVLECAFVRIGAHWRLRYVDPMPMLDQPGAAELVSDYLAHVAAEGCA